MSTLKDKGDRNRNTAFGEGATAAEDARRAARAQKELEKHRSEQARLGTPSREKARAQGLQGSGVEVHREKEKAAAGRC